MMEIGIQVVIDKETELWHFEGITLTEKEMQALVNIHKAYQHDKRRTKPYYVEYEDVNKLGLFEDAR